MTSHLRFITSFPTRFSAQLSPASKARDLFRKCEPKERSTSVRYASYNIRNFKSRTFRRRFITHFFFIFIYYFIGVLIYNHFENWCVLDSIYFITTTAFSVGYGDYTPTTFSARWFTSFFMNIGNVYLLVMLAMVIKDTVEFTQGRVAQRKSKIYSVNQLRRKAVSKALKALGKIFFCVLVGSGAYTLLEKNWDFVDCFYFSTFTAMTVGYGDITPTTDNSKIFTIFFVVFSIATVTVAQGDLLSIGYEFEAEKEKLLLQSKPLDLGMIQELDTDGNGIDKFEFVVGILHQIGAVNFATDVQHWVERFDELDKDHNGRLDKNDIKIIEEKERLIRAESSEDGGATSRISAGNSSKGEDSKPVKKKRGGMRGSIEFAATQVTLLTGLSIPKQGRGTRRITKTVEGIANGIKEDIKSGARRASLTASDVARKFSHTQLPLDQLQTIVQPQDISKEAQKRMESFKKGVQVITQDALKGTEVAYYLPLDIFGSRVLKQLIMIMIFYVVGGVTCA